MTASTEHGDIIRVNSVAGCEYARGNCTQRDIVIEYGNVSPKALYSLIDPPVSNASYRSRYRDLSIMQTAVCA